MNQKIRIFYATGITYPSLPVSRQQILHTSEAFYNELGEDFLLGCASVASDNKIYRGKIKNFGKHKSIVLAWKQLAFLRNEKFNILYAREPALMWGLLFLNKFLFRLPLTFVFESHTVHDEWRFRSLIREVSFIFCVSEGIANELKKKPLKAGVYIARNGINLNLDIAESVNNLRIKYKLPMNKKIVTYVGSIGFFSWKGEDVLLEARNFTENTNIHYVIAGVKDEDLERIKAKYGNAHTSIIGRLNETEVAEIQKLSNILVLPNKGLDAESTYYSSPIKMFEYMRSGNPIIAAKLPCIEEVLNENNAYFFNQGSPKDLADKIVYISSVPDESRQKAEAAYRDVKQYSWKNKVKGILKVITK